MKSKVAVIVFGSIAAVLLVFFEIRFFFFRDSNGNMQPKVVTPAYASEQSDTQSAESPLSDSGVLTSFIPLLPTETLMSTLTIDFDGDTFDDQIAAVYKAGSPFLFIIVGLYNPDTNTYDRSVEIPTEISKIRTFFFNGIDMTGEHKTALVYQGVKDNGDSVMQIFFCRRRRGNIELQNIGDFTSDGTIFIQQSERSEAYELFQSRGADFPVWVYSSDRSDASGRNGAAAGISQIQTEYKWNEDQQRYVQSRQLRVTGSYIAAKELARIQNGSVETFAQFLNGLWYKTATEGSDPLYIYFNYDAKEVIFLSNDTEGVYSWEDSNLRRSGIYLTTVNSIIASMQRRFDIMLTGVNEISVHVHDNVGMLIKENNLWDGTYKKMSFQSTFGEEDKGRSDVEYRKELEKGPVWVDDDGRRYTFSNNEYKFSNGDDEDSGIFVTDAVGGYPVIQFRSASGKKYFQEAYAMQFASVEVPVNASGRNSRQQTKKVMNTDIIVLRPVSLSPDMCYAADGYLLTLTRGTTLDTDRAAQ